MMRVTRWIVLDEVCWALRGVRTWDWTVLLRYKLCSRPTLWGCKASVKEEEAILAKIQGIPDFLNLTIRWHSLTQRGFERQWFADSLMLDSHDSEKSYTAVSVAAAMNLIDKNKIIILNDQLIQKKVMFLHSNKKPHLLSSFTEHSY